MTLILNEIHVLDGFNKTLLISAADRRVIEPKGNYSTHRKLFPIPYLKAHISYHGLATVYPSRRLTYLSEWVPNFIKLQCHVRDLRTFVFHLREELHKVIPPHVLAKNASGFHLLGYNPQGLPDFWYLSNIGGVDSNFVYTNLGQRYREPSQDFLAGHAKEHFGWDGVDPKTAANKIQIYRNGDYKAHAIASEKLDQILGTFFQFPDFNMPKTEQDYVEYVRAKFAILAYIYKRFAKRQVIAGPIDVFSLSNGML